MRQNIINKTGQTYSKPWGTYKTIEQGLGFQAKIIHVFPQGSLSLQKHFKRQEHWVVIEGVATITVNQVTRDYQVNEYVYIPKKIIHRLENKTNKSVTVIEIQIGSYLGEDDIIRLDDIYQRT